MLEDKARALAANNYKRLRLYFLILIIFLTFVNSPYGTGQDDSLL